MEKQKYHSIDFFTCVRCAKEKPRKSFQRSSKIYKSCNDCANTNKLLSDKAFLMAQDILNGMIEYCDGSPVLFEGYGGVRTYSKKNIGVKSKK